MWLPLDEPFPVSSFVRPIPVVGVEPDASPCDCYRISSAYRDVIVGALNQLINPATWDGTDAAARELQLERVQQLLRMFAMSDGCTELPIPKPGGDAGNNLDCDIAGYLVDEVVKEAMQVAINKATGAGSLWSVLTYVLDGIPGIGDFIGPVASGIEGVVTSVVANIGLEWVEKQADAAVWNLIGCNVYAGVQGIHGFTASSLASITDGLRSIGGPSAFFFDAVADLLDSWGADVANGVAALAGHTHYSCAGCGSGGGPTTTNPPIADLLGLAITDDTQTIHNVRQIELDGATLTGTPTEVTWTVNPTLKIHDGTHDVSGVSDLTFFGAVVGGATPNGMVTITPTAPLEIEHGGTDFGPARTLDLLDSDDAQFVLGSGTAGVVDLSIRVPHIEQQPPSTTPQGTAIMTLNSDLTWSCWPWTLGSLPAGWWMPGYDASAFMAPIHAGCEELAGTLVLAPPAAHDGASVTTSYRKVFDLPSGVTSVAMARLTFAMGKFGPRGIWLNGTRIAEGNNANWTGHYLNLPYTVVDVPGYLFTVTGNVLAFLTTNNDGDSESELTATITLYPELALGSTGATGPQGPKGDKGDKGDTGSSGGAVPHILLEYVETTDLAVGLPVPATTWHDVCANKSFTAVGGCNVEFDTHGVIMAELGSSSADVGCRLVIDSAGTPIYLMLSGCHLTPGIYLNALAGVGPRWPASLSAGQHTVKLQVYGGAAFSMWVAPASHPNEHSLGITVVEYS